MEMGFGRKAQIRGSTSRSPRRKSAIERYFATHGSAPSFKARIEGYPRGFCIHERRLPPSRACRTCTIKRNCFQRTSFRSIPNAEGETSICCKPYNGITSYLQDEWPKIDAGPIAGGT